MLLYSKHGYNIHGVIFDELHAQQTRDLWDVLTEGASIARTQPLVFAITTAGYDMNSICWEVASYARKVRDGIISDPRFLPVIYSLENDEDWRDEKNWAKVNPALGHIFTIEDLRDIYSRAEHIPARQNTFRRLHLNQWVKQVTRFIPMDFWDACGDPIDRKSLKGKPCYGGLDLSSTMDITAFVKVFPRDDGGYDVLAKYWIPEDNISERVKRDKVPYDVWVREGYMKATPGNTIDYKWIIKEILKDAEIYNIREIGYDRWGATQVALELESEGITVVPVGQGFQSLSNPTKDLLRLVMSRKIRHGADPVLRWMADNLAVKIDPAENVKPDKSKSTDRIDGIVALIMALDRAIRHSAERESIYRERGFIAL